MNREDLPRPAKGFCVNAELKMTPDRGIGVFAAEFIPANTIVCYTTDDATSFDENEAREYILSLSSKEEKVYWIEHVTPINEERVVLDHGDLPLVNHSSNPTIFSRDTAPDGSSSYSFAARDVNKEEELTEDYRTYPNVPFLDKLMKEYGISVDFINYS